MKQPRPPFIVITFLAILGMLSAALPAGIVRGQSNTLTFKPSADAYVIQSSADANFGSNVSIRVDNVPVTRSYLRFAVSGLNGAAVQSAKLRIYANSSNSTGYSVRALGDNGWAEDKITYNNSPAQGDIISKSGQFGGGSWTETDVTSYIKGDGTYNLVLTTSSETSTNLAAREDGAHAPQLVVVAAGSQPPAPTAVAPTATQPPAASPTTAPTNPPAPTAGPTQAPTAAPTGAPTTVPTATQPPASGDWQPAFPIRAAFYYPWFAEAWTQQGIYPYTNYTPVLGYYSNTDANIIKKHIDMMQYGNIQVGISSWWGQGQHTDTKFPGILAATAGSRFRWTLYYENESMGDPSVTQIRNDLTYIRDRYSKDPSFLRVNGKFVVFVYSAPNDVCGMADRWKQANTVGAYIILKVFPGYASCASQPDSWHQYSPAVAADSQGSYSYAISPGFWLKGNAVRLGRDLNRWIGNVKAMAASGANWQLITTFSEWGEGTIVEPAKEWTSASGYGQYLDALHNNGGGSAPVPVQTATVPAPQPTATSPAPRPTATSPGPQPTATSPAPQPTATQPPSGGNDPILFFQGDLVSGSSMARTQKVVALIKNLIAQNPGRQVLVASTGDNEQENAPTLANYQQYFGTTYGTFFNQGIFRQVRGNHDVQDSGHGAAYAQYFGSKAYINYSYDFGGWHIVGIDQLNSSVNTGSLNFLKSDLAANAGKKCQLVYWHVPTYSSGSAHGDSTGLKTINQAEYDAGVDIQINGHDHHYQRFYPLNPSGARDDARGITTFIDGIGGQDGRSGFKTSVAQAASVIQLDAFPGGEAIGTIMFTLHPTSADYKVYNANGGGVIDQGTVNCH